MPWPTAGILRPEDLDVHAPVTPPYLARQHDLVVATNMLDHGVDVREVDLLRVASLAHDMGKLWIVEAKHTQRSTLLHGEELTRSLLRTAEEIVGFPCVSAGLLHGLATSHDVINGQHRIAVLRDLVVHLSPGLGKSASLACALMERLRQGFDDANRDGRATTRTEIARLTDAAIRLSGLLRSIVQRRLDSHAEHFAEPIAAPLTESSPCGVLRLAARRVPRAPGGGLIPGPSKFALAA